MAGAPANSGDGGPPIWCFIHEQIGEEVDGTHLLLDEGLREINGKTSMWLCKACTERIQRGWELRAYYGACGDCDGMGVLMPVTAMCECGLDAAMRTPNSWRTLNAMSSSWNP